MKALTYLTIFLFLTSASAEVVVFKETDGKTEFRTVGRPAMFKITGEGSGPAGQLTVVKKEISGSLKVNLSSLTTKIDLRDDHMKNKYLEISKYPEAVLELKNVVLPLEFSALGKDETEVAFVGQFTLHGETKPVSGIAKIKKINSEITGSAEFNLKIMDYLSTLPNWLGVKVAEDVPVKMTFKGIAK